MKRPELDPADAIDEGALVELLGREIAPVLVRAAQARAASPVLTRGAPDALASALGSGLPLDGAPLDAVLGDVERIAVRFARHNAHPGFFGYICGPGLPTDPLAHALAATINQNVTGFPSAPGAAAIERQLVGWMAALAGMPPGADGLLVSGGSIANLTALASALHATLGIALRRDGLAAASVTGAPTVHLAPTAHFSIERAAWLLGLGAAALRYVDVDAQRRMRPDALAASLERCRAAGERPACVVATAGATTTGTIDPLVTIADVCAAHGVWLHVDAAYGGAALLSDELRPALAGIERADSVTIDFHKWIYVALAESAVVFRDPRAARSAFHASAEYVERPAEGAGGPDEFFHVGPETSRPFRALAPWLALRAYGVRRLGRNIAHNARCAAYLGELVAAHPELELVSPPALSICCFRYAPPGTPPERVDAVNTSIRDELEREGTAYLSRTTLDRQVVLRVCISNHATRAEHVERLVDDVVRLGRAAQAGLVR